MRHNLQVYGRRLVSATAAAEFICRKNIDVNINVKNRLAARKE